MINPEALSYFGSMCATIAAIPQILRVIRLKDAHSLSYSFLGLRMVSFFSFMIAIIITGHLIVASSYLLIIAANGYLMFLKIYYAHKRSVIVDDKSQTLL